jgi:glycosyltransferase involved in cell wall biosynthesis
MTFVGRIQRNDIARIYRQAHLFVLPTISDGFAIVQLEAMAHGLPVITTPNCGRVVDDGQDGIIVPAMNSEAIVTAIARLDANRKQLVAMSRQAFDKAGQFELPRNAEQIEEAIRVFKTERAAVLQGKPAEKA